MLVEERMEEIVRLVESRGSMQIQEINRAAGNF